VVRTLTVNADRMAAALESGFSQATDLAEYVMQTCDVDYRTAYEVVGIAVRTAHAEGLRGVDLDGAMLDAAAVQHTGRPIGLTGRDLSEVLDPRRIVATRTAAGGAAPPVVEAMAASCREQAAGLLDLARRRRAGFRAAERRLVQRATDVAAGREGTR
jgi:argininosuccinate lyase